MTLRFLAVFFGLVAASGLAGVASASDETGSPRAQQKGRAASDAKKAGAAGARSGRAGKAGGGSEAAGAVEGRSRDDEAAEVETEKATFAGGCFWSIEAIFERVPGVKSVVSGFAGGNVPNPSYELVGTGQTGHAESVQIEYDPAVVSYETLLKVFWAAHDPTTLNSQGDDFGPQYRSVIFYHTDEQRKAAQESYRQLTTRRVFRSPIVTELVPLTAFYPAEPYHQNYYRNHLYSDYSQIYIVPKLKKLKLKGLVPPRPSTTKGRTNPVSGSSASGAARR